MLQTFIFFMFLTCLVHANGNGDSITLKGNDLSSSMTVALTGLGLENLESAPTHMSNSILCI